jgi:hypothetical protein
MLFEGRNPCINVLLLGCIVATMGGGTRVDVPTVPSFCADSFDFAIALPVLEGLGGDPEKFGKLFWSVELLIHNIDNITYP